MITLGIETSCDETALSLIETTEENGMIKCRVIHSLVHSQAELHSAYGGVYPSLAKREHGKNLFPLLKKLLIESSQALKEIQALHNSKQNSEISKDEFKKILRELHSEFSAQNPDLINSMSDVDFLRAVPAIDRLAVTEGPGLEPALWVGINFARILGRIWNVPIIPVNHMEGHIVGSLLDSETPYGTWQQLKSFKTPAIAFLISGGHTELVKIELENISKGISDNLKYTILGQTKDDAVGEAFDKVARLLGLPYPGGPHISRLAHEAEESKITSSVKLPRPMINSGDLAFSFSGLKTAVLYAVRKNANPDGSLSDEFKKGLALEFENSVVETLDRKLKFALEQHGAQCLIVGGGVSANHKLRTAFKKTADEYNISAFFPSLHVSGDNALMIAVAGTLHTRNPARQLTANGTMKLS